MQHWAIGYWMVVIGLFGWIFWNIRDYRKLQRRRQEIMDRVELVHHMTSQFSALIAIRDKARAAGNEELANRIDLELAAVIKLLLDSNGGAERASAEISIFVAEHGLILPLSQ